ncbi:MAG TPA: HlyD family type I secretion periplasmic adaptor subunit [Desulfobacteraceae bacterium]|nr:HlyD family type I secretion periplasmic adaptor subunit [Deltaproteobacteria bacterium]MBW2356020.1 HlyD family type I secretion periplasmic adaptor subunit [Deltaproteobacteria bacterium]RLB98936.1 MAG: HlyD family type I secretion periplasmic adaptor subunit [Deltaproteobacteria bacterium]HDI59436.1 HlyD family type I secretion periplasmic adaptor subunit [Desulfobacteraceae bacterium]
MPAADVDLAEDIRMSILAQSPRGGRAILYVVVVFVAFFFYWASVSEIEEVTRGHGKVIPSGQIQVVQNLEGGILSEILVGVGDMVKKGQLLLRIDEKRFSSSFQQNRVKYLSFLAKAARLRAEASGEPFEVPEEVAKEMPEIARRERELYQTRMREFESSQAIRREQISQRRHEIRELNTRLAELTRTQALIQKELDLTRPLVSQGAASEVEVLRLERQASEIAGDIATTRDMIPRAVSKLQEAQLALEEVTLKFSNEAKAELNDTLAHLEEFSANAIALEDRLRRTAVRSPVNGTINRILVNTVGGVIRPGMDLIEIVPMDDTLLVEARIKPSDIAFLRPDQKAKVKFTAYDFTIYGGLDAELEHISADSITDEQGNSFYLVNVRTRKNYLGSESDPLPIIPGMVATVDILTGKKTILSYILKPVLRAKYMALRER